VGAYRRLVGLGRHHLPALALGQVAALAVAAADLGLLALVKRGVDLSLAPAAGALAGLLGLAAAIALARELASYAATRLTAAVETAYVRELQDLLHARMHALSLDFFARHPPGDLMARLFHDTEGAAHLVTGVTPAAVDAAVRLAALFTYLAWLHPELAAVTALCAGPAVLLSRVLARRARRGFHGLNEATGALFEAAHQSLGAAEWVQTAGGTGEEAARFAAHNCAVAQRQRVLHHAAALGGPLYHGLRLLGLLAAFAFGARAVAAGELGAGALAAALLSAYAVLQALETAAGLRASAQRGLASADRVLQVLDAQPSVTVPAPAHAPSFTRALRFERVGFTYPGRSAPALVDVDLTVRPGEKLAIVGPTGGGKTTLLRLALRLFDPCSGAITLDGVDLRQLDLAALRRLFAVVPQDVALFDRTLRENIAYAAPEATAAEVDGAARLAGVDEIAAGLPRGLETVVGPRGAALSGGQRQQVAIARAFVRRAPILLLDEATAALDAVSERRVQDALDALGRGRTTLVVAHRLSTLLTAERILVLAEGRLVEQGSHAELAARAGHYRRLIDGQRIA
jgi:ATP-binding cassette subfamily B protein